MAFLNMWSELVGTVPELSAFLARTYLQRAWTDVAKSRTWSWKQQNAFLNSPVAITAGTVSVTAFSVSVQADATAKAALNAASAAGNPALIGRQFRQDFRGPVYTIANYNTGTGVITLDQPYQGTTAANSQYTVYKCLYEMPGVKVNRVLSVYDPNNGYAFTKLHVPQAVLNRMDPTRSSQQMPYWLVDYDASTTRRNVRYEFWPHPITAQTFVCELKVLETNLVLDTDELPDIIPESLVVAAAFSKHVVPWALANSSRFPRLKGVNWGVLKQQYDMHYRELLAETKKDDDGRMLASRVTRRGVGVRRYPIDANFIQTHDVNRL